MNLFAKLIIWALKHKRLSLDAKSALTAALLDNMALPIRSIISYDKNKLLVNGKEVSMEQAIQLKESARAMLHSCARRIVQDSVLWLAVQEGVHKGTSPDQILFAKAAIWQMKEEEMLYRSLAQEDPTSGIED